MKTDSEILYNQFAESKKQQKYIWISSMVFVTTAFISVLIFLAYWSGKVVVIKENGQRITSVVQDEEKTFKAHAYQLLDKAFHYANSFDRFTYKENQAKTLFFMDARSANRLWTNYENNKVFADVLSKGTVYDAEIIPESINISGESEPFNVSFQGTIKVKDNGYITEYRVSSQAKLIYYTPYYPHNPYGFFLTDYVQKSQRYEQEKN